MSKSEAWSLTGIIVLVACFLWLAIEKTQQVSGGRRNMVDVKIIEVTDAQQQHAMTVRGPTDVVSMCCRRDLRPGDRVDQEWVTFCGEVRFLNAWARANGFPVRCHTLRLNLIEQELRDWQTRDLLEEFGNPFIEDEPAQDEVLALFPPES